MWECWKECKEGQPGCGSVRRSAKKGNQDAGVLEGVQRRATRMIRGLRKLSYDERLKRCQMMTTLEKRRSGGDLIEAYKILSSRKSLSPQQFFEATKSSSTKNVNVVHLYSAICIASEALLLTVYIALLPKGACGRAGWVSNTTHYDCCHYRRMREHNSFGQPERQLEIVSYTGRIRET